MATFQHELISHFNTQDWDVLHYASEQYKLKLENHHSEIFFALYNNHDVFLYGDIHQNNKKIIFVLNPQSKWLRKKPNNKSLLELLEHLFLFMKSKGENNAV